MNDLIKVNYDNADCPTVSGRELHERPHIRIGFRECASMDSPRARTFAHF